jgi:hypothetical protein
MTPLQGSLTALAWLLGLGGLAFAFFLHLANAMKTTSPPMSPRGVALSLAPALATAVVALAEWTLARREGNVVRVLAWNVPALLGGLATFLMTAAAWTSARPSALRRARERRARAEDDAMSVVWQRSGRWPEWDLQVERGFETSFPSADGAPPRTGVAWLIRFVADGKQQMMSVRSFAAGGASIPLERQAQCVLRDLAQRLSAGWRPDPTSTAPLELIVAG